MKNCIFVFLLVLLSGHVGAALINVEESIAANTVWSFSVSLPAGNDFDEAEVLLDGSSLISFYTTPNDEIVAFDQDPTRVFSFTEPIGNTVYLLVSPRAKGSHKIVLTVDGEEEADEEINFFEILDAGEQAELQGQLNSIKGSVSTLIEQLSELDERALDEEDRQQLQSRITGLKSRLDSIQSSLQAIEAKSTSNQDQIQGLAAQTADLERKTIDLNTALASTGLFGLARGAQSLGLLAIALVAAAISVLVAYNNRHRLKFKRSVYGKQKKPEPGLDFSKKEEEITGEVLEEEGRRGRWAYGNATMKPEPKESKRFQLGDLLKK